MTASRDSRRRLGTWWLALAGLAVGFAAGIWFGIRIGRPAFRLSPHDTVVLDAGGDRRVEISYGRPYVRQRRIFGDVVPFGKVWRTGADEATTLRTSVDLEVGAVPVPAGEYTLYTVPRSDSCTLVINRQTGQWGTEYDQQRDLARVEMTVSPAETPVEQLTFRFEEVDGETAADPSPAPPRRWRLVLEWERLHASVPISLR